MKPLNIVWVGISLIVLSAISKQIGFDYIGVGFFISGMISMLVSLGAWIHEGT